jgi:hypothetical protein
MNITIFKGRQSCETVLVNAPLAYVAFERCGMGKISVLLSRHDGGDDAPAEILLTTDDENLATRRFLDELFTQTYWALDKDAHPSVLLHEIAEATRHGGMSSETTPERLANLAKGASLSTMIAAPKGTFRITVERLDV